MWILALLFAGATRTSLLDGATLLQHLNIDNAVVFDYSLGGGVAWPFTIRHRELVCKLVVGSATYNNDGLYPEVLAGVETMFTPEALGIAAVPDSV